MKSLGLNTLHDLEGERRLLCTFTRYASRREHQVGRISVRKRWQRRLALAAERIQAIDGSIFESWSSEAPTGGTPLAEIRKAP